MKKSLNTTQKNALIGAGIILIILGIGTTIGFAIYNSVPKIVYKPAVACELLTAPEVREILGENALNTNNSQPVVTKNTAISRCGYTNGVDDAAKAIVAAIVVRSGVNDEGVLQNKKDFASNAPNYTAVEDLGDDAYFDSETGQLNVIRDKEWIILSLGTADAPTLNSQEDTIKLAEKVLN